MNLVIRTETLEAREKVLEAIKASEVLLSGNIVIGARQIQASVAKEQFGQLKKIVSEIPGVTIV
jgi:hypothetical protein